MGDNPENMETIKKKPNNILESNVDPNEDENVPLEETSEETRNKYRFREPKNHPISNVIGNLNEHMVTRKQLRLNEMGLVCVSLNWCQRIWRKL